MSIVTSPATDGNPFAATIHGDPLDALRLAREAISAIFPAGQVTELRVLSINGRDRHDASGTFNDPDALAQAVLTYDSKLPSGVYYTINPIADACLNRTGPNKVKEYQKITTSDRDVICRNWLPIDIDPKRPAGVSSSNEELALAMTKAQEIAEWMRSAGWPEGIVASSGNGAHLLYRIDVQADDDGLVKKCINALADRFSDATCDVDETVFNQARIWKAYGSTARKGFPSDERPHRRAKIITDPVPTFDQVGVVDRNLLQELAKLRGDGKTGASRNKTSTPKLDGEHSVDLEVFMSKHGIASVARKEMNGGGYLYQLDHCVFNESHTGSEVALGRNANKEVFFKCQHDSCSDKRWKDVWNHFEGSKTKGKRQDGGDVPLLDPQNPLETATQFRLDMFTHEGIPCLYYFQETYWHFNGSCYEPLPPARLKSRIYEYCGKAESSEGKADEPEPFKPNRSKVADILEALQSVCVLHHIDTMPAWLSDVSSRPDAENIFLHSGGYLDLETLQSYPSDPALFMANASPVVYSPDAPDPELWLNFLNRLWPDDPDSIEALRAWFAYCLTPDTSLQKCILLVGPRRGGKGTITRILTELLGPVNVAGTTSSGFAGRFGLQNVPEKRLVTISDARFDGADVHVLAERILCITGEDGIDVNRKYLPQITGAKLPVKLMFTSNELPKLSDTSSALPGRFITLQLNESWYGREDTKLERNIRRELPGILKWAVQAWPKLQDTRVLPQPASAAQAIETLERLGSPLRAFVSDRCKIGPAEKASNSDLFDAYKVWCAAEGRDHVGTKARFCRDLLAAVPGLRQYRPRDLYGNQTTCYEGIGLF